MTLFRTNIRHLENITMIKYKKHIAEISVIAAPMVIGNLGHVLTGATDVFVAAKHSVDTLAAIAIANSIFFTIFILGLGLLTGISIILSNKRGAKHPTKKYFLSGVILSQILAFFTWIAVLIVTYFMPKFGFEAHLVKSIQDYMYITSFSLYGMFLYQGIKEFLQAHEIVNFPNLLLLISVVLNLALNFIFVFGWGIIPALGIVGLSIATLISRTVLGLAMVIYTWKIIKTQQAKQVYDTNYMKNVLRLGFPIGVGLLFEFLSFNIITIAVGREAGVYAATQNILITIIDIAFMIPLSISSAIAIKVGYFNGAKNLTEIRDFGVTGTLMSLTFMMFVAILYIAMPETFIGIFTSDKGIIDIALPIVHLFALSEIADGVQISLGGMLKGLKMTKQVTAIVISCYWLLGIPIGFYLAYAQKMYLKGFWIGLTIALFCIAVIEILVITRKYYQIKRLGFAETA